MRNVGGGRPRREDRAAHGQPGKVGIVLRRAPGELALGAAGAGARRARRRDRRDADGRRRRRGLIVDQLARDPEGLCASLALALESVAHPKQRLAFDALLVVGPEHGRVFGEAGWDRARVRERLFELTTSPAGELVRGAGGSPEGIDPQWVADPEMPVAKFAAPERILLAYAGGDAGLFSMVFGSWAAGEIGSAPRDEERGAMALETLEILDPTAEREPSSGRWPRARRAADDRAARHPQAARRRLPRRARARCCASAGTTVQRDGQADLHQARAARTCAARSPQRCDAVIEALAD